MAWFDTMQDKINKGASTIGSFTDKEIIKKYMEINQAIDEELLAIYKKYNLPILLDGKPDGNATIAFMKKTFTREKGKAAIGHKISRLNLLKLQIKTKISPILLKIDKSIEATSEIMFQQGYYWNAWSVEQAIGVDLRYPLITESEITAAVQGNPWSIFFEKVIIDRPTKIFADRQLLIDNILKEIEMGFAKGDSYLNIAKKMDIILGFRDASGNWLEKATTKAGATYKSLRIARTELPRVFALGRTQEFLYAQNQGVKTRMKLISTLDDRTRPQSAQMDGQFSNEKGEFEYPNIGSGNWKIPHNTGVAEWDINDREATIQVIDGFSPKLRRARDKGLIPAQDFKDWAKNKGLKKNVYGQVLFPGRRSDIISTVKYKVLSGDDPFKTYDEWANQDDILSSEEYFKAHPTEYKKYVDSKYSTFKEYLDNNPDIKLSIDNYIEDDGFGLNEILRQKTVLSTSKTKLVKSFDTMFENVNGSKENLLLYRGGVFGEDMITSLKANTIFRDLGYVSTSTSNIVAKEYVKAAAIRGKKGIETLFKIRINKGSKIAPLFSYEQSEFLINKASKFKIISKKMISKSKAIIEMELL